MASPLQAVVLRRLLTRTTRLGAALLFERRLESTSSLLEMKTLPRSVRQVCLIVSDGAIAHDRRTVNRSKFHPSATSFILAFSTLQNFHEP
jgi:hypothetical protein